MTLLAAILTLIFRPHVILDQPAAPGAPAPRRCYCSHPRHDHRDGSEWCDHCTCSFYEGMPTI